MSHSHSSKHYNWVIDPFHSQLSFSISHLMGITDIWGSFNEIEGGLLAYQKDFSDAVFSFKSKVASIETRVAPRDTHLRSADFFDAEKHPFISFESTGIKPTGGKEYELTGNLTMKGITKPVTLQLTYTGTNPNPLSNNRQTAGFKATGAINRYNFGVGPTFPDAVISNAVKIVVSGEFFKPE